MKAVAAVALNCFVMAVAMPPSLALAQAPTSVPVPAPMAAPLPALTPATMPTTVGLFTSPPKSFSTANYWVTGPQGVWSGVPLKLHVLGPGCSAAHVVAQVQTGQGSAVFVGDLVNPDNHAWLELGCIDDWLQRLDEIRAMNPVRVYPGRGQAGGPELLTRQAEYLRFVQKLVQAEKPSGELGWFTKQKLQRQIEGQYPSFSYPIFMRDGLAAVWREEASKRVAAR
jgi:hypothetical protein